MGFIDKAKDLLDQHDDKVDAALEKAGELAKRGGDRRYLQTI